MLVLATARVFLHVDIILLLKESIPYSLYLNAATVTSGGHKVCIVLRQALFCVYGKKELCILKKC